MADCGFMWSVGKGLLVQNQIHPGDRVRLIHMDQACDGDDFGTVHSTKDNRHVRVQWDDRTETVCDKRRLEKIERRPK